MRQSTFDIDTHRMRRLFASNTVDKLNPERQASYVLDSFMRGETAHTSTSPLIRVFVFVMGKSGCAS